MSDERDTDAETENETGSGDEQIDEQGRNPTQQRMDEEGVEPAPVDASWTGEAETGPAPELSAPAEGSDPTGPAEGATAGGVATPFPGEPSAPAEGSDPSGPADVAGAAPAANEPIFEPDVPLVAEVNREAGAGGSRKGVIAGVAGAFALLGAMLLRRRR
jgi:hypothetical protein